MSYTVLARKYRPRNFTEMVGQDHVVQALSNALTSQRLHHAYLFTGTRGVGKTTVSRVLAKSLNCVGLDGQGDVTAQPCGQCQACLDIDAGRFVDYTELDAASNRGVDEVQQLLEQAVYKPVQGRYKVFMIDEVHMLTNTAFNAMLKTLEEPPEYLKFVLATTDPQKVPVTVLSRCLQFNLRPMPPQTIADHLAQVLTQEAVPFEVGALRHLGGAARGSMRDALSLTDQAIAYGQGQLQEAGVREMLGVADQQHVFGLIEALAHSDGAAVVQGVDTMRLQGHPAAAALEAMAAVLQRVAVAQLAGIVPDADDPEAAAVQALAEGMPADEVQLLYSLCLQGRQELGLAVDEYAGLLMVLLRLLAFKPQAWGGAPAEKKSLKIPTRPDAGPASSAAHSAEAASDKSQVQPTPLAVVPALAQPDAEPPVAARQLATRNPASAEAGGQVVVAPVAVAAQRQAEPDSRACDPDLPPWEDAPDAQDVAAPWSEPVGMQRATRSDVLSTQAMAPLEALARAPVRETSERLDQASAAAAAQEPTWVATEEGDFWFEVVHALVQSQAVTALARELALQSQMVARDTMSEPPHWLLRVERASLNQAGARERLLAALADAGHQVALGVEVGVVSDTPGRRIAAAQQRRLRQAEASLRGDPALSAVFSAFGGTIVAGSLVARGDAAV
jgi:DNA polymerase III subunit gamma/tau